MASVVPFVRKTNATDKYSVITDGDGIENTFGNDKHWAYFRDLDGTQFASGNSNASYDLRVGDQYWVLSDTEPLHELHDDEELIIKPGKTVIICTEEETRLPKHLFGIIFPKVSLLEKGLANVCSKVDPGFEARLRITVFNLGRYDIKLKKHDKFCSITLLSVDDTYEIRPYGKTFNGPKTLRPSSVTKRIRDFFGVPANVFSSLTVIISIIGVLIACFKP